MQKLNTYININSYMVCLKDYFEEIEDQDNQDLAASVDVTSSQHSSKQNMNKGKNKESGKKQIQALIIET